MGREIKFRAWEIFTPKMIYDFVICQPRKTIILNEYFVDMNSEAIEIPLHLVNLMQYTGLKDCEGKEIYEGDVVEYIGVWLMDDSFLKKDARGKGVVIYEDAGFFVDGQYDKNSLQSCDKVKIIGNIYENPELLEADNEEKIDRR